MKHILLAIFILLGTQPVTALGCDMHAEQAPMAAEHNHMAGHDMAGMDCCDEAVPEASEHCASMDQCATSCAPGLSAIFASIPQTVPTGNSRLSVLDHQATPARYYTPLFRPPIS